MRFLLMLLLAQAAPAATPCADLVCVEVERAGGETIFYANSRASGVTFHYSLAVLDHQETSRTLTKVLQRGRNDLLSIPWIKGKEPRYEQAFFWETSVPDAVHNDAYSYRLPFGPERTIPLGQGPHGAMSHQEMFAYDFGLPRGAPVCAARGGIVEEVVDEHGDGALRPEFRDKANIVRIAHDDGTVGSYVHLERGTVRVKAGDVIDAGQVLASCGTSGYSDGPHLHFDVVRLRREAPPETLPVKFHVDGKDGVTLQEKHVYRADSQCTAGMIPAVEAH